MTPQKPTQKATTIPTTGDEEQLRTCVIDLLNYFDSMVAAAGHTFGLPRLTLASLVTTYGIRVEDVFFKLSSDASAVRNLTSASITDAVNLFVTTENNRVSQKYMAWLQRLRECIVSNKLTGTFSFDAIVTALTGATKCLSVTTGQAKELAKFEKELKATKASKKFSNARGQDKLSDVASELVKRLGVASAVDFFSTEFNSFVAQKSSPPAAAPTATSPRHKFDAAMSLSTKVFKTYFADVKKSLAYVARLSKAAKQEVPKILAMHVARNAVEAAPLLDGGDSFVVIVENMQLRKGHAVSLDAAQLLARICVTIICILQRLSGNVNQSRDFALSIIDVLLEVFAAESSSKAAAGALLTKLRTSPNKAFSYNAQHSRSLARMGLLGGNEQHVVSFPQQQQQQQPEQQQQQPAANNSNQQPPANQQPQMQHVQVHDDPYMKTCFGCFVGLEACQTAMMCCEFCGE